MTKKFIDVSEHNTVDWSKAKSEVTAVYIRCGLRGSLKKTAPQDYKKIREDKKWRQNLSAVQKQKIPFSAYYFPTACTDAEAIEGAKWFYAQVKDLNMAYPPILDSENVWGNNREAGRANSLSKAERTRLLKIVTDYFNAQGMNIGIYASASWLKSKLDMSAFPQCVRDCTWVADSTGPVDYDGYYWLHQYGKGPVAGCSGDIDLNKVCGAVPAVFTGKKAEQTTKSPIDVVIEIAQAQVGYKEGANNKTKYGDDMHALQPKNMDKNAPWCDAFVDWCVWQMCELFGYGADTARKVLCGDFDDYTYNSVAMYKKAGRWAQNPSRGDQIFFGGAGHTGIVTKVENGKVYTIEGNKSDQVKECVYKTSYSDIIGYGMPKYYLVSGSPAETPAQTADDGILRKGSKGNAVRVLQLCLGGLDDDGSFGNLTLAAVKSFQQSRDLTVDGEVGPKTWASIVRTLPLLERGSKGRYVKALQIALGSLYDGDVDGSFGWKTLTAVIEFQKAHGLDQDGEVGPLTWAALVKTL